MAQERFSQTMSTPTYAANPVSSKAGLINNELSSLATTLDFATTVGGKVIKSAALSGVESSIQENIQEYLNQSPTQQGLLKKEVSNLETKLTSPDINESQIKTLTSQLNETRNALARARDQGTITPLELETRLDKVVREKVAQNPAFRNEIISHAAQTKDLLGISQIMQKDTAFYNEMVQAEKEARTRMYQDVNTYHIDLNKSDLKNLDGSINPVAVDAEINRIRGNLGAYDAAKILSERKDLQNKSKKEAWLADDRHLKSFEGALKSTQIELVNIWDDPTKDINSKILASNTFITTQKQIISNALGRYNNDKDLSFIKDDYNSITQNLQENYKNIKSGKEMKEFLENNLNIITAKQNIGLNNVVNTTQMKFMADVIGKLGNNIPQNLKTQFGKDMITLSDAFLHSNITGILQVNQNARYRIFKDMVGSKKGSDLLLESVTNSLLEADPTTNLIQDNIKNYEDILKLHILQSKDPADERQGLYVSDKIMQSLGDSRVKSKGIQFSEAFKSELDESISSYATRINTEITNLKGKPDGVILGVNPDGTLIARKDPSLKVSNESLQQNYINRFNSIIVSRINNSMKAYATTHNTTTQAVSADFIRQYYGPMFSNLVSGNTKPAESSFVPTDNQKKANEILGIPNGQ